MPPIVAQRIDVPPNIATVRDRAIKSRSAISADAASRPEIAAIGTPGPGWVLPPARYRPGTRVREPGRRKLALQPCELGRRLAVPVSLLVGGRDGMVPSAHGRRLAALLPHARLVPLPGLGHLAQEEAPDLVAELIADAVALPRLAACA